VSHPCSSVLCTILQKDVGEDTLLQRPSTSYFGYFTVNVVENYTRAYTSTPSTTTTNGTSFTLCDIEIQPSGYERASAFAFTMLDCCCRGIGRRWCFIV
jgi:hypothetical protein